MCCVRTVIKISALQVPDTVHQEVQAELLLDQLDSWKIPVIGMGDQIDGSGVPAPKPLIIVAAKYDIPASKKSFRDLLRKYETMYPVVPFSTTEGEGVAALKTAVFEHSRVIRVYSKEPGKKPDMKTPFTVPAGSNVLELAEIIHKDFAQQLKYACVWGSGKFDGQRVQKDYVLHDRDIVEYHIR